MMRFAAVRDRAHALGRTDVARIDAQLVHAVFDGFDRKPVVEMHVGDERNMNALLDAFHRLRRRLVKDRDANDLAPRLFEPKNLIDRRVHVARVGVAHGLYGDRRAAADLHVSDLDKIRHISLRSSA